MNLIQAMVAAGKQDINKALGPGAEAKILDDTKPRSASATLTQTAGAAANVNFFGLMIFALLVVGVYADPLLFRRNFAGRDLLGLDRGQAGRVGHRGLVDHHHVARRHGVVPDHLVGSAGAVQHEVGLVGAEHLRLASEEPRQALHDEAFEVAGFKNAIIARDPPSKAEDPDFDPALRAFYYVRVIEIPTPLWTAYDAKYFGIKMPAEVRMTTTERAYTSPIWYTPGT